MPSDERTLDMAATTKAQRHVRVSDEAHRTLQELAATTGLTMTAIIDRALDQYRREQIFAQAAAAWKTMEADLMAEYSELEGSIADGLEREEW
jgi:predicted transcriptional regulator